MPFRVDIVQCRGTAYEIGRAQARSFAATPKGSSFLRRKTMRLPPWFDLRAEGTSFARFAPALWEEIGGLAEGLGIAMERAVFCFGNGGLRPPTGGCSAVMSAGVYARNYDFYPRRYGARLALVQPAGSHASIGSSELLTGRLDGMNAAGLTIGLHGITRAPCHPGLSCVVLVRIVLDRCATTAEAVALLQRLPHAMRFNYSLLDAAGESAVVEAIPGGVAVRTGPFLACTNHFQSPLLAPLTRRAVHSQRRLPPLEAWAEEGRSADGMFAVFNGSLSPAFHHAYGRGFGTLHTIVSEPAKRRVMIGIGGDAAARQGAMLDVAFDDWLEGRDLPTNGLEGQLGGTAQPYDWPLRSRRTETRMKPEVSSKGAALRCGRRAGEAL